MKQTIEVPDLVLHNCEKYPNDVMKIYVRKNKIVFSVAIDGAGNEFEITKERLKKWI